MSKTKIIDKQLTQGSQSVNLVSYEEKDGKSFKFSIQSDSYKNQCYARASLFDGDKWHQVYNIHYNEMTTPDSLAYCGHFTLETKGVKMLSDLRKLRTMAHTIVGVK